MTQLPILDKFSDCMAYNIQLLNDFEVHTDKYLARICKFLSTERPIGREVDIANSSNIFFKNIFDIVYSNYFRSR